MTDEQKLMLLRMQLFTAMQQLKGGLLSDFWKLIDEVQQCRVVHPPPPSSE